MSWSTQRWVAGTVVALCVASPAAAQVPTHTFPASEPVTLAQAADEPPPGGAAASDAPAGPPPATGDAPAPQPLPEVPETTVVGAPEGVGSQGSATPGDTPIESASRTTTPLANTGSSVSVVTAEQLLERGYTTVGEALRGLPGVDVVQQSVAGSVTSVFLRGGNSSHTKVLLDGLPLNDPISTDRAFDFSNLAIDDVERIEVVRGPQSTLYGSDALGGVINIVTRKGKGPPTGRASAMGGSFYTSREAASLSGGNDAVYYSVAGSYFDTNGFSAASERLPGNSEDDGFRLGTFAGRTGWTPFENFDVDLIVRYNRGTVEIDEGGGPNQDDPLAENFTEQTSTLLAFRYTDVDQIWTQRLRLGVSDVRRAIDDPLPFAFKGVFNGQTRIVDWQHDFVLTEWNTATVGWFYQVEEGSSGTEFFGFPTDFPQATLRDNAVYFQDAIQLGDRWFTTLGARQDDYSQAGLADTYRATTLYRLPGTETGLRGSIGTGFKAPTLFQLFDPFSGNAALSPENSKGWDCGVEQPLFDGDLVLSVTYFRNDFRNLIDFDPATFQFFNIAEARALGIEYGTLIVLDPDTTLTLSYTQLRTRDLTTGLPLLRRPQDKAGLVVRRRVWDRRGTVTVSGFYVGDRDDRFGFPSQQVVLKDYFLLNLAATFDLTRHVQLFGRVDNTLNQRYEEVYGFGVPRISAYAGAAVVW